MTSFTCEPFRPDSRIVLKEGDDGKVDKYHTTSQQVKR